jgi:hypothetical protein
MVIVGTVVTARGIHLWQNWIDLFENKIDKMRKLYQILIRWYFVAIVD